MWTADKDTELKWTVDIFFCIEELMIVKQIFFVNTLGNVYEQYREYKGFSLSCNTFLTLKSADFFFTELE